MKNNKKIIFLILISFILIIIIDLLSIYIFKRPILAISNNNVYYGLFYNTYICSDEVIIQNKISKFNCKIGNDDEKLPMLESPENEFIIDEIIDKTKENNGFGYAQALEKFYEDETYEYYFSYYKSSMVIVKYTNGIEEDVKTALNKGRIKITNRRKETIL